MPFAAGDRFVIYTDGVVEMADAQGNAYGVERLQEVLELPESALGQQLERALGMLIDRVLARPERRGRTVRAVVRPETVTRTSAPTPVRFDRVPSSATDSHPFGPA